MKEGRISWTWRGRVRRERVRDSGLARWMSERGAGIGSRMVAPLKRLGFEL